MENKKEDLNLTIEKTLIKAVSRKMKLPEKETKNNKHFNEYYTTHASKFQKFNSSGRKTIEILPFLKGKKWDDVALGYIHAARPSAIRVTTGSITLDSLLWRVTVYINNENDNIIEKIVQEVEIGLPEGIANGEAMHYALKYGIDSPQCQWYNDNIESYYMDGINDKYYKILSDGTRVIFPYVENNDEES